MPETQETTPRPGAPDGILDRIVHTKREEVRALRGRSRALTEAAGSGPPPLDFRGAIGSREVVSLIAEVKRRSPGAGAIRPELDPVDLALRYQEAGASALSVLTDSEYFGGSLSDLTAIRARSTLPLLRKDFTLDPIQIWEARSAGADAILLIVRILDDGALRELRELAESLGMAALVEAHDAGEVERALASGARILGVNNRDLATFITRLEVSLDLLPSIPSDVVFVSESGIRTVEDVLRLGEAGADAILVGETLLRASDPGAKAAELANHPRRAR